MKAISEGTMELTPSFVEEMDFCLDCQACESACPAGVQYGQLVEHARTLVFQEGKLGYTRRLLQTFFFRFILPYRKRLQRLSRLVEVYEKSGVRWLTEKMLDVFFPSLATRARLLPSVKARPSAEDFEVEIKQYGTKTLRVGILTGCLMDIFYHAENIDTVRLLSRLGFDAVIPAKQNCCGSLPGHYGDIETARRLARETIRAFDGAGVDVMVMNSAGCGAFMKGYVELFAGTTDEQASISFSKRVKDLSEFLVSADITWPKATTVFSGARVTFHDPCHLVHTQGIYRQPRELIKSVPGIEFVELPESTWCCGSAGLYNVLRHEDSKKLLERKLSNIMKTNVDIVVTSNHGCMAQLAAGLRTSGASIQLMHLATFLRQAYDI